MSTYQGPHAMSMEMVLGLIGQTLGSLEDQENGEDAEEEKHQFPPMGKGNGRSFITEVVPLEPLQIPSPSKQPITRMVDDCTEYTDIIDDSVVTGITQENHSYENERAQEGNLNKKVEVRVQAVHKAEEFMKPYSVGLKSKSLAQENLFAPQGLQKRGPEELPHTADLAKYKLTSVGRPSTGSRVGTTTTNQGMRNGKSKRKPRKRTT